MHKKRSNMPKNWPVPRKGKVYFSPSSHASTKSIPVVFAVRDILKIVTNRKEARLMSLNSEIKINNVVRKNVNFPVQLFDILTLDKLKKNYVLESEGKRLVLKEISEKDSKKRLAKVIGKVSLKNKKVQINLDDGTNFLYDNPIETGDSVVISLETNKIEKVLSLKEGAKVRVIKGKHSGKIGKVNKIESNNYTIKFEDGEVTLDKEVILAIE